ncbi:MAG: M20 family metallo-hydrolase [Bacteroidaceae bacterium]
MEKDFTTQTNEAIELLATLIKTPSISRKETDAADVLASFMEAHNIPFHRDGNNLWAIGKTYEKERPTLLLNAHLDTVKPAEGWTHPPFVPTREGDRLYGLGSNDCGGGLVSLLQVFRILSSRPQPYNLVYAASCEEEVSGKNGFEHLLPLLPPIQVAIVGEPTQMQPAIAEKGLMVLDVTVRGKAGHAARKEGVNAIYKAIDDINWFRTYQFPKVSPLLGEVKMTVTIVHAGEQHNVVPDLCTFTVDVRSNECYKNQEILDEIGKKINSEVKARSTRLGSSHIDKEHPIIQRAIALGRIPFGSPTLSDQALMPFASFKMGPGNSARSHTADEYIETSEIAEAIQLYIALLDGLSIE